MEQEEKKSSGFDIKKYLKVDEKEAMGYLKVFAIYLVVTAIIFWPMIVNMTSSVMNGGGDAYQSLWNLWWVGHSFLHTSIYKTDLLFAPVGANLATQTLTPLAGVLFGFLQVVNLTFEYNVIFILGYVLSGLFAYMLVDYITKDKLASLIGGLIYMIAPLHIAQYGHLDWTSIEFIPLFILFLLLMIKEKKHIYAIGAGVSFVFLTFFGDVEQGIMMVVFTILFLLIYLAIKKERSQILNLKFAISLVEMVVVILILGSPFLIPLYNAARGGGSLTSASELSGIENNEVWSIDLVSFFAPTPYNNFFSGIANSYSNIYTADPSERVGYLGYVVIALCASAIYFDYKKNRLNMILPWVVLGVIFAWLSIGPYLQVGGAISGIPGLYLAYHYIPLFNIMREPDRFDFLLVISLSILGALGFKEISEHMKLDSKKKTYAAILIFALIGFEYAGIPFTHSYISQLTEGTTIPIAYYSLGSLSANFTTLMLPAVAVGAAPELYPGLSMYYETAIGKPIIGGYTSRVNASQSLSVGIIPLTIESSYLQMGEGFGYSSPILENYTDLTLLWLYEDNVAFVSFTRQAYNETAQGILYEYMTSVFGDPVYEDNTTFVFDTQNAINTNAGRTISAYPTGVWIPGYSFFCTSSTNCNSTLSAMWWGTNTREVTIFSHNATYTSMYLEGLSYYGPTSLSVYLNQFQTPVATINLTNEPVNYTVQLHLTSGFNNLVFYTQNSTNPQEDPYVQYGLKGITFT